MIGAPEHLPEAGDAGRDVEPAARPAGDLRGLVDHERARPHEAHLALQHVPQLRQLVEAACACRRPPTRVTRGSSFILKRAPEISLSGASATPLALGAHPHGAELDDPEDAPAAAVALLPEEHGPAAVELHGRRDQRQQRRQQQQAEAGDRHVHDPLGQAHAAREAHRREVHDRHSLQLLDGGVGGEHLEEARHDREVHVRAAGRAQQVERLLVRGAREREDHPVDLELVHEARQVCGAAHQRRGARRHGAARRRSPRARGGTRGER